MSDQVLETNALGRPFRLAMLYDRKTDSILPGESLFTKTEVITHSFEEKQEGLSSVVTLGSSLEKKSNVFGADANLQLNFMKGTLKLGASGKYLSSSSSSEDTVHVCLSSNIYTCYKELDITALTRTKAQRKNISNSSATHIVTAMKCGAVAYFQFERKISSAENKTTVEGEMTGSVANIPSCSPDWTVSGKSNSLEKTSTGTEKMSCKFFGDLILNKNPTTYEEAVTLYKMLPSLIKGANAPVTVWLYPLSFIDNSESYIERKISHDELHLAVDIYDRLSKLTSTFHDLLGHASSTFIPQVKSKLQTFESRIQSVHHDFRSNVEVMLTDKSSTERNCNAVNALENWLSKANLELGLLNCYLSFLENIAIIPCYPIGLETKLLEHDYVVHVKFAFPMLSYDPQPSTGKTSAGLFQTLSSIWNGKQKNSPFIWYADSKLKLDIRKTIKRIETLKSKNEKIAIVVTFHDEKFDSVEECITAYYFHKGEQTDVEFDILGEGNEHKLPLSNHYTFQCDEYEMADYGMDQTCLVR